MVLSQTDWMVFLQITRTEEQGLGHLFITSSSSHFFNKTDFEQYLFNVEIGNLFSFLAASSFGFLNNFVQIDLR